MERGWLASRSSLGTLEPRNYGREVTELGVSAEDFIAGAGFRWHQRFELAPGIWTPGTSDVERFLRLARLPADLSGMRILDVGTSNGGTAFACERRGAEVVAADIVPPDYSGFARIRDFLGSSCAYVESTVYELPERVDGRFDVVLFLGVLYHLRHPLLALDALRRLDADAVVLETEVADRALGRRLRWRALASFHRGGLHGDATNWFVPTVAALEEWCASSGFVVEEVVRWPPGPLMTRLAILADRRREGPRWWAAAQRAPAIRALLRLRRGEGQAEFEASSWAEGPFRVEPL